MTETTINVGQQNGQAGPNLSWIQFNVDYFKTRDGLLKLAQLVSFAFSPAQSFQFCCT